MSNTALGEHLAVFALNASKAIYDRARQVAHNNLALLDPLMRDHQDLLRWVRPCGGMTAMPWLTGFADSRNFCQRLAARGVLIVPGDCFGMPSHFRLGFGATAHRFQSALERLAEFLHTEARQLSAVS